VAPVPAPVLVPAPVYAPPPVAVYPVAPYPRSSFSLFGRGFGFSISN